MHDGKRQRQNIRAKTGAKERKRSEPVRSWRARCQPQYSQNKACSSVSLSSWQGACQQSCRAGCFCAEAIFCFSSFSMTPFFSPHEKSNPSLFGLNPLKSASNKKKIGPIILFFQGNLILARISSVYLRFPPIFLLGCLPTVLADKEMQQFLSLQLFCHFCYSVFFAHHGVLQKLLYFFVRSRLVIEFLFLFFRNSASKSTYSFFNPCMLNSILFPRQAAECKAMVPMERANKPSICALLVLCAGSD